MKRFLIRLIVVAIVCGLAFAACRPLVSKFQEGNKPDWRTVKVSQGRILFDVRATGTVKPVLEVSIGSFVSGPITDLYTDFNQEVKKDDLLARVDPRLFKAAVARDMASLGNAAGRCSACVSAVPTGSSQRTTSDRVA